MTRCLCMDGAEAHNPNAKHSPPSALSRPCLALCLNQGCEALWETLFTARWGEPSALTRRAAKLASAVKGCRIADDLTQGIC